MLGIVFTSLIDMMEEKLGLEMTEQIIDEAKLQTQGSYTAVGYYDPGELFKIVTLLSNHTGADVAVLVQGFGEYLFEKLADTHPHAVAGKTSVIQILSQLDSHIHVEVKKLYPDADLPTFKTIEESAKHIKLLYSSKNHLEPFANGLIVGASRYFDEQVSVEIEPETEDSSFITVTVID